MYVCNHLNSFKENESLDIMTTINSTYHPRMEKIEKEEQILELLQHVKGELCLTEAHFKRLKEKDIAFYKKSLTEVLEVIEEDRKYEIQLSANPANDAYLYVRIRLLRAKDLIEEYRRLSQGGCISCKHREIFKFPSKVKGQWCNLYEDKSSVDFTNGLSTKIEKYFEKGCKKKDFFFKKTIEQIIKEAN